jgi:ABC-type xylose transport system permease subunit
MDKFREHYLQALGTNDESKLAALQETAHSIRQFEIELYWKRAAYFWAFQLVSFAALGLLFKDGKVTIPQLLAIPSSIGVITAFAGVLTARGSKFWQENWEAHVDLLEGQAGQRLTQVVMCRRPAQFSVSRVNECLLYLLTGSWMVVLVFSAIPQAAGLFVWLSQAYRGIAVLVAVIVACGWMWHSTRTHFTGRIFRLGGTRWTHYKPLGSSPLLIGL